MKTLIILGHPDERSLCHALGEAYSRGALEKGAEVEILKLNEMKFNLNLKYGYRKPMNLEPDLERAQELISWADKLVFVYPVWWGGVPALLKGFIDRTFLPGFAFNFNEYSDSNVEALLTNKSGRLVVTSDSSHLWLHLKYMHPAVNMMKKSLLEFCGVDPVDVSSFSNIKNADAAKVEKILYDCYRLGLNDH